MERYPTRDGMPIPTSELLLPPSNLDTSRPESFNTHHRAFTARSFGRFLITQTLRDLKSMQDIMPMDVHTELHRQYEPPQFPTIEQAIGRVGLAYESAEPMRIRVSGSWLEHPISDVHFRQMELEYDRIR